VTDPLYMFIRVTTLRDGKQSSLIAACNALQYCIRTSPFAVLRTQAYFPVSLITAALFYHS